ncbi:MAG: penicillin-binding protein activator [Myxococcales bacterium]|nr:penicillin-binding protein activator [Myxococcales bacterium]
MAGSRSALLVACTAAFVACGAAPPPTPAVAADPTTADAGPPARADATPSPIDRAPDAITARLAQTPPGDRPTLLDDADPATLEAALPHLEPTSEAAGWIALRLGRIKRHQRQFHDAATLFAQAAAADGAPADTAKADLAALRGQDAMVRNRIAALLPLSGPYAPIGETALNAIRLALMAEPGIELIVGDTAGEADRAVVVLTSLVRDQHVAAVIGPVGTIESFAVAQAAERLETPVMTLSAREDLPRLGTFVFRHRLTRGAQAEAIARHAIEDLGIRTFAILYPEAESGRELMTAFWRAVESRGGEVRGAQGYSTHGNDFNAAIKKLIGRHHLEARTVDPHWEQLNRKSKDKALHVPPVVDFEGLFIADSGQRVRLLLPFLSYWDIEVKNDPNLDPASFTFKYGGEPPQLVQILGASGFNDPRLTRRPPPQALNSVFIDAFWPESEAARPLVEAWLSTYGRPPPVLAAHAFDATQLVARAVRDRTDRASVRRALLAIGDHRGVFGATRVAGDGEVQFDLELLTLDPDAGVVPFGGRAEPDAPRDEDAPGR